MKIDDALLAYLEGLSCLTLQLEEKEMFKNDLSEILRFMETLDRLDVTSVHPPSANAAPMAHPFPHTNAFRDDIVTESADRVSILSNASDHTDEYFKSPLTVKLST